MVEPVGLAAGLLAFAEFAFKASKELHDAVASFNSYWPTIRSFQEELSSLVTIVQSIREQAASSQNPRGLELLTQPLEGCGKTCEAMLGMLQSCTKHSKDNHTSLRDWTRMQYRGTVFEDYKKRLSSFKSTLDLVLNLTNLNEHSVTQNQLEDLKNKIEGTQEEAKIILENICQLLKTAADMSNRKDLESDRDLVQRNVDNLTNGKKIVETTRPSLVVQGNVGGKESLTLFGAEKDSTSKEKDVTVADNKAGERAKMAAGMHSNEVLLAFLKAAEARDTVRETQPQQTSSQSAEVAALQTVVSGLTTEQKSALMAMASRPNPSTQQSITGGATVTTFNVPSRGEQASSEEDTEHGEKVFLRHLKRSGNTNSN